MIREKLLRRGLTLRLLGRGEGGLTTLGAGAGAGHGSSREKGTSSRGKRGKRDLEGEGARDQERG